MKDLSSIVLLIAFCTSTSFGEFTYEEGEWETMLVDLISREVSGLPIEDFVDDPQLIQKVDRVNKLSLYFKVESEVKGQDERVIDKEETNVVYRRKFVDTRIPVIVLRSEEDHLKVFHRKRTFVVLRQNPLVPNYYFASYVYLRFWTDKQDKCTETYLNEKICLEWDSWDNDRGEIKTKGKYFGWTDCASSVLFSCPFRSSDPSASNASDTLTLPERGIRNTTLTYAASNSTQLTFTPHKGFPFDDTIDAFWDLETNAGEGHYIRETIRHSSVFNKPESFLLTKGKGALGRSFGSRDEKKLHKEFLEVKKRSKVEGAKFARKQVALSRNFESRSNWLKRKNLLNSQIRAYAKELGHAEFYKIKKDPKKMSELRQYRNASRIFEELERLGESYHLNEDENADENLNMRKVKVIENADEGLEASVGSRVAGGLKLTEAFGRALSDIVVKTGSGGMSGRSLGQLDSKVAQTIAKSVLFSSTDTFEKPGWKLGSGGRKWRVNGTFRYESSIFYGLGSCPFKAPLPDYLNLEPGNKSQVTQFFLTVLRTDCYPESREYVDYLMQEKYLFVDRDRFAIPKDLFISKKAKLGRDELRKLSAAMELSSFSQNYAEELKHSWTVLESSEGVSRSVHYLLEFGYVFVSQARLISDQHFLKLVRNLVLTFKSVFTKLLQDYEILVGVCQGQLGSLEACKWDLKGNYNDRLAVHSFAQFLSRGIGPLERNKNVGVEEVFKEFTRLNRKPLLEGLDFYN